MESLHKKKFGTQIFTPLFIVIWCAVFVRVSIGNTLLNMFVNHSLQGGAFYEKIHPGVYLLIPVFIFLFLHGKTENLVKLCKKDVNSLIHFFLISLIISIVSAGFKGISGLAYLVETHISAAAFGIVVYGCSAKQKKIIKDSLLIFILLNSLLAIGEFLLSKQLFGFVGYESILRFRSTAFFGHPLTNSLVTTTALFFLFTTQWSSKRKIAITLCYAISLLCFGGRAAWIVCIIALSLYILARFFKDFKAKPRFLEIAIFIYGVPLLVVIGTVLVENFGFGTRIFGRELFDQSGMARINLFSIFYYIPTDELLIGMSRSDIADLSFSVLGVETIENFWVMFILVLGWPAAVLLGGFLLKMLFQLSIHQQMASKAGTLAFLIVASTNNSLASKSVALTFIILLLVTNFTPTEEKSRSR